MPQRRKKAVSHRPKKAAVSTRKSAKMAGAKKKSLASAQTTGKSEPKKKSDMLPVYDLSGKSVDTLTLDPIFHEGDVNTDVLHQAVVMYQAGQREGTAATKTRGEVSGGGKKPWKQKGTGRARHASIRSPIWTGGGTVFGPHPRDYSYAIPLQVRRRAVAEGVKSIVSNGKLTILKDLALDKPKTKGMARILATFKSEKPLVLVDKKSDNLVLASRNIPGLAVKTAEEVNALDVLMHKECLMTRSAYAGLLKRLKQ
jgi:large subunit ribosomal protein L4